MNDCRATEQHSRVMLQLCSCTTCRCKTDLTASTADDADPQQPHLKLRRRRPRALLTTRLSLSSRVFSCIRG